MALVDYSSDSSHAESSPGPPPKRKRKSPPPPASEDSLPPLPSSFLDLYSTSVRTSLVDDPSLHGGRHRETPHIAGNWPTHVYTEWYPSQTESSVLENLIKLYSQPSYPGTAHKEGREIHSLLRSSLGAPQPLHISLSRSLSLDTSQRDSFPEQLQLAVEKSGIQPFSAVSISPRWVPNYSRTRWFIVLQLERPEGDKLNKLLKICNRVAVAFGLAELYTGTSGQKTLGADTENAVDAAAVSVSEVEGLSPKNNDPFHISIAWTLSEPKADSVVHSESGTDTRAKLEEPRKLCIPVSTVKVKVGNMIANIPLEENSRQYVEDKGRKRWLGQ